MPHWGGEGETAVCVRVTPTWEHPDGRSRSDREEISDFERPVNHGGYFRAKTGAAPQPVMREERSVS